MVAFTWGRWPDGGGDAVGAAVVQQPAPPRREAAPGQQHRELGVAVARDLGGELERGAGQAPVGAVDDVERQARQPEPAPVPLEGAAASTGSTAKCTARRWSGDSVRAYCTARAVARSIRSTSTTTTWWRSTGASHAWPAPASSCLVLLDVLPVQAQQDACTPRGMSTTTTQAPSVNLVTAKMSRTTNDNTAAVPLMADAAPPVRLAVGQVELHHPRPGHGEAGEHADGVEGDQAVELGLGDEQHGDRHRR